MQVIADNSIDALFLDLRKQAISLQMEMLILCYAYRSIILGNGFIMPDKIINRNMKIVCNSDQRFNVRFDIVVLIFVDRLLAYTNGFSKSSL